jgi:hypothetical protein
MKESAKGPSSGYIYQFEIGLLELTKLNKGEAISIEHVDDVAVLDAKGTYIFTIQAKHSITASNSNFGNTSEDLWKTLNIWISKLHSGILVKGNRFTAITNKKIPSNAIIRDFTNKSFSEILTAVESIKKDQEDKLNEKIKIGEKGNSHTKTIFRINEVLSKKAHFQTVVENFEFNEMILVKESFLNKIFTGTAEQYVKDNIYHTFLGWIQDKSKEFWLDKKEAIFKKEDFDAKYNSIRDNHSLVNAIFRGKNLIENINPIDVSSINRNDIYIKQIEDIGRFEKEEIIKKAILDFIYKDIEMVHQIKNSPTLTKRDFEEFESKCQEYWSDIKRKHIKKNPVNYSSEELNDLAICIYDEIMVDLKLDFQDSWGFNDSNRYIQNGTFLSLANVLKIGWHPDWEKKYKSK